MTSVVGKASSRLAASRSCPTLARARISSSSCRAASRASVFRSPARSASSGKSASTRSRIRRASSNRSACISSRTTRSRSSESRGSTCLAITRSSTSRGIELVAIRMSSSSGCSVCSPSTRVQRGVISLIPCTTSSRPEVVARVRTRRPYSSNGVAWRIAPMPATRRPVSGIRWGMRIRSIPGSTTAASTFLACRFETITRASSSSHIRTGCDALPPRASASSGSTATPGRFANRPSSTRPSASSTRSARVVAGAIARARNAAAAPCRIPPSVRRQRSLGRRGRMIPEV